MGREADTLSQGFSPSDVLADRLASGEFYEMKRLRGTSNIMSFNPVTHAGFQTVAIFTAISNLMEKLDGADISAIVSQSPKKGKGYSKEALAHCLSVYRAMLRFTVEYFTRSARSELTLKALALDVAVSDDVEACTILRTFIVRLSGAESFVSRDSRPRHDSSHTCPSGRKRQYPQLLPAVITTNISTRRLGFLR